MMQQTKSYFRLDLDKSLPKKLKKNEKFIMRSGVELQNLLETLCKTDNIDSLDILFSRLGFYMLSNPQHSDMIIKFKPLYDKIIIVLNEGQPTKMKLALNLISSLMFVETNANQNNIRTIRMYAQNMIRISGCLLAMCYLFTNCMMQHETWNALCQSLSETCYKSVLNQNYCSHLVPLCIQRCRRGNPEALLVLQSLLIDHEKNIKIFYEFEGMSIFSRETLLYTTYLQTLNTVIEGTKSTHQDYIRNSKMIFKCLHRWLLTDETSSPVTKWAAIVLYSRRKLLGVKSELSDEESYIEQKNNFVSDIHAHEATRDFKENRDSETGDLFRNIIKEMYEWNTQTNNIKQLSKLNHLYEPKQNVIKDQINNLFERKKTKKPLSSLSPREKMYSKRENTKYRHTNMSKADSDLSFSFLINQNKKDDISQAKKANGSNTFKNSKYLKGNREEPSHKDTFGRTTCTLTKETSFRDILGRTTSTLTKEILPKETRGSQLLGRSTSILTKETSRQDILETTTYTLKEYGQDETGAIEFRPPFVSTPKNLSRQLRNLQHSKNYKKLNKINNFKRRSPCKYNVKNRSMAAKFMDIINGSCTTIVQSFTKLKNVFIPNTNLVKDNTKSINKFTQNDCSYSFTNYMTARDALCDNEAKNKCRDTSANFPDFSKTNNSCHTCNDTIVLKHKLSKHSSLKESVKKLKIGINMYGCDFKKISRILWAREPYMTPDILYMLYRKLIAK